MADMFHQLQLQSSATVFSILSHMLSWNKVSLLLWKKCTTLNVPTCGDWLPVCFSDVWRGREHPVLVATEGPISTSWHLIHCSVCLLKLKSTWTQLCEVPIYQLSTLNYPWIVTDLIHTHPHCNPTSSPADSFTQDDTRPLMPAKVGFPYPHGPLNLVRLLLKTHELAQLFPKSIFEMILKRWWVKQFLFIWYNTKLLLIMR